MFVRFVFVHPRVHGGTRLFFARYFHIYKNTAIPLYDETIARVGAWTTAITNCTRTFPPRSVCRLTFLRHQDEFILNTFISYLTCLWTLTIPLRGIRTCAHRRGRLYFHFITAHTYILHRVRDNIGVPVSLM